MPRLFIGQHVLAKAGDKRRQAGVDRGDLLFGFGVELGPGANKGRIRAIEHPCIFGAELQCVSPPLQIGHAGKEFCVEKDRALMCRQGWRQVALDCLQGTIGIGTGKIEEHAGDAAQKAAALLKSFNGVGETRPRRIGGDGRDLLHVFFECGLERGSKMHSLNAAERSHAEGRCPMGQQQRIGRLAGRPHCRFLYLDRGSVPGHVGVPA